jgi:hypothetical protein
MRPRAPILVDQEVLQRRLEKASKAAALRGELREGAPVQEHCEELLGEVLGFRGSDGSEGPDIVIDGNPVLLDQPVQVLDVVRIRGIAQLQQLGPVGFRKVPALAAERHIVHASVLQSSEIDHLSYNSGTAHGVSARFIQTLDFPSFLSLHRFWGFFYRLSPAFRTDPRSKRVLLCRGRFVEHGSVAANPKAPAGST